MKGTNLPTALISVMVGALLVFLVVVPIAYNGVYGTLYEDEAVTNTSVYTTYVNFTTSCTEIRADTTWLTFANSTGDDVTADITIADASAGNVSYTDTITATDDITGTLTYRCYDAGYISNSTARGVASVIPTLVVVLVLVSLAGMMYMKQN